MKEIKIIVMVALFYFNTLMTIAQKFTNENQKNIIVWGKENIIHLPVKNPKLSSLVVYYEVYGYELPNPFFEVNKKNDAGTYSIKFKPHDYFDTTYSDWYLMEKAGKPFSMVKDKKQWKSEITIFDAEGNPEKIFKIITKENNDSMILKRKTENPDVSKIKGSNPFLLLIDGPDTTRYSFEIIIPDYEITASIGCFRRGSEIPLRWIEEKPEFNTQIEYKNFPSDFLYEQFISSDKNLKVISATLYISGSKVENIKVYQVTGNRLPKSVFDNLKLYSEAVLTFDNIKVSGEDGFHNIKGFSYKVINKL